MRRLVLASVVAPLTLVAAGCATRSVSPPPAPPPAAARADTIASVQGRATDSPVARVAANRPPGSTLVVVVRHAEKATAPANDPPLSAEGSARAQALAAALADVRVSAIIVTATRRTSETAAAVARAHNLTPEVIGFGTGVPEHAKAVASAVRRHAGGIVLVVGHSNTVPAIVDALGGPKGPDLCESQYSQMYLLVMPAGAGVSMRVHETYGAADPPGADGCAAMRE